MLLILLLEDYVFRVYSGKLNAGSYVLNTRSDQKERISRIFQMHSNNRNSLDVIEAGDIGAAVGLKILKQGIHYVQKMHQFL